MFYQEGSGPLLDVGVYGIHEALGLLGPALRVSAWGPEVARHALEIMLKPHESDQPGQALTLETTSPW
ncbi:hypothetical protein [Sphaerisporangium corydalis]|uniref:LacI family transcriptional regulator n=1 Tax=Sphaerisporangium corydalis TaxID=1441875 RepID=A0ABV9EBX1_9ACTN|nr:hypothetical protein [Sphaerisporangium corydalis]